MFGHMIKATKNAIKSTSPNFYFLSLKNVIHAA